MTTQPKSEPIPVRTMMMPSPAEVLPMYECKFCGNQWIPRKNVPKVCPGCHRRKWYIGDVRIEQRKATIGIARVSKPVRKATKRGTVRK
jgi:hypothetical protein